MARVTACRCTGLLPNTCSPSSTRNRILLPRIAGQRGHAPALPLRVSAQDTVSPRPGRAHDRDHDHKSRAAAPARQFRPPPRLSWPLVPGTDKLDYVLRFPDDECLVYTRPVDRLLGPSRTILPLVGGELRLNEDLFRDGEIALPRTEEPDAELRPERWAERHAGIPGLSPVAPLDGPGAAFLCIEPCRGHADSIAFAGDYSGQTQEP